MEKHPEKPSDDEQNTRFGEFNNLLHLQVAQTADWLTLWQSELAALAGDRETREIWHGLIGLWQAAAAAMLCTESGPDGRRGPTHEAPAGVDGAGSGRPAGADAAAGAAAAAAAPDAGRDEIGRLRERVAELERLVAGVSSGRGTPAVARTRRRPAGG